MQKKNILSSDHSAKKSKKSAKKNMVANPQMCAHIAASRKINRHTPVGSTKACDIYKCTACYKRMRIVAETSCVERARRRGIGYVTATEIDSTFRAICLSYPYMSEERRLRCFRVRKSLPHFLS